MTTVDEAQRVFARHGVELRRAKALLRPPPPLRDRFWSDPGETLFALGSGAVPVDALRPGDDDEAVLAVEVFRTAVEAERGAVAPRRQYAGTFVHVSRRGNLLVYWDRKAPLSQRLELAAALRELDD